MRDYLAWVLLVFIPAAAVVGGIYVLRRSDTVPGSPARRAAMLALRIGAILVTLAGLVALYFVYLTTTEGFGR
jgi:hypothetical protein